MGFFDQLSDAAKNIGAVAGDLAKQVGEKANDALEITKLNAKIASEKAEIDKEMKKISEALFEKFSKGEEVPEEYKSTLCKYRRYQRRNRKSKKSCRRKSKRNERCSWRKS